MSKRKFSERDINDVKINYKQSTKVVLFKNPKYPSGHGNWPDKLVLIVYKVFNKVMMLDHGRYLRENGMCVFYTEPYIPLKEEQVDYEMAAKYGVEWIELENHIHDETTTPYKILIRNPGSLHRPDMFIGYRGNSY